MTTLGMAAEKTAVTAAGDFAVTTIYTNIAGQPTADVPGYPGVHFGPGTSSTHFDRVYGSPNGNWILTADTDRPTTNDEVIIVNGEVKIFEGDPAPWATGENTGFIDQKVGINDNGSWVFATNTDGATTADEYMVVVTPSDVYTTVAKESDPVDAIPGTTWGSIIESPVIAEDGTTGLVSDLLGGLPTTEDEALLLGDTALGQEGITTPPGQINIEYWENFDAGDFWISSNGDHWLAHGDLTGDTTTDDVVVVDGRVVIQEGVILTGTSFVNPVDTSGIVDVHMAPNGNWFVRGNNNLSETDWVFSNQGLLATLNSPIFVGATEVFTDTEYSDCFFIHVGDSNGNYVIAGVSDGPTSSNGVLVANNQVVIAREGDQIDLDNDGILDDAYFDTFGNDDAFLADDGTFYIVATIKDGTDTRIGQGFFSIDIASVTNTPPTLSNLEITSPIDENGFATLTGDITDPNLDDTFTLVVDWGNGTVVTTTYPTGTVAFTETYQYLDDAPTGTASDAYTVSLSIRDSYSNTVTGTASVTVNNLAPVVNAGSDQATTIGQMLEFNGSFTDPGSLDTHTINWDFGDGDSETGTLTPIHSYDSAGTYTVTLTISDDDTGIGVDTLKIEVTENLLFLPFITKGQ